jgi:hypothetical protein
MLNSLKIGSFLRLKVTMRTNLVLSPGVRDNSPQLEKIERRTSKRQRIAN